MTTICYDESTLAWINMIDVYFIRTVKNILLRVYVCLKNISPAIQVVLCLENMCCFRHGCPWFRGVLRALRMKHCCRKRIVNKCRGTSCFNLLRPSSDYSLQVSQDIVETGNRDYRQPCREKCLSCKTAMSVAKFCWLFSEQFYVLKKMRSLLGTWRSWYGHPVRTLIVLPRDIPQRFTKCSGLKCGNDDVAGMKTDKAG